MLDLLYVENRVFFEMNWMESNKHQTKIKMKKKHHLTGKCSKNERIIQQISSNHRMKNKKENNEKKIFTDNSKAAK